MRQGTVPTLCTLSLCSLGLVLGTASRAGADVPTPLGAEFVVNTYTTSGQQDPAVAVVPDTGFVVVWQSNGSSGDDSADDSIQARFLDETGAAVSGQFQVNQYTTGFQGSADVAADPDAPGEAIVTWIGPLLGGDQAEISAIRIDSSGSTLGVEFSVNQFTLGNQNRPSLTFLTPASTTRGTAIDWVAMWSSRPPSSAEQVRAAHFDASDLPVGGEQVISAPIPINQRAGAVVPTLDGGFVAVYFDSSANRGVSARRYDSGGTPANDGLAVSEGTFTSPVPSRATRTTDGSFIVAWEQSPAGVGNDILARGLDSTGLPVGSPFVVNAYTTGGQGPLEIASTSGGGFVVAWETYYAGSQARTFAGPDDPASAEFPIGSSGTPRNIDVAVPADDRALFVWTTQAGGRGDSDPGDDIYTRVVDLQGRIFEDGFEDENPCAWSDASPTQSCP